MKKRNEKAPAAAAEPEQPALGLESEFVCIIDGEPADPKEVFGDPRSFLPEGSLHRTGTSYHLATGGAVYFDTGVIEVVTPVIEIGPAAAAQAVRSLGEAICAVREGLNTWETRERRQATLAGFSTHYNVSLPGLRDPRRIARLGFALAHLLPFPVMLLAANRRSTGVGVRPRPGRLEVTVDFTPDPALTTAAAAVIVAAVMELDSWPRVDLQELERRGCPIVQGYAPVPHTSRKGWLAKNTCFDPDPFQTPPDEKVWLTTAGDRLSTRQMARGALGPLRPRLERLAAPLTLDTVHGVLTGSSVSLLDLPDRPASYEDVGRACAWRAPMPGPPVEWSEYERAMREAMAGVPIRVAGTTYRPVATAGWTRITYQDERGRRRSFSVDQLVRLRRQALGPRWRGTEARRGDRRGREGGVS